MRCRPGVPNRRVSRWLGASPNDPLSSATLLRPRLSWRLWSWLQRGRRWVAPFLDQRIDLLRGQVVVIFVVEPHHRRELTRSEALDLLVGEEPVLRDLARLTHAH